MAHRKAGGSAKNLRDSNPQFLGIKISDGGFARAGTIILRQRGTKVLAGRGVFVSKDHTLHAKKDGFVKFSSKRKKGYNGVSSVRKTANIV